MTLPTALCSEQSIGDLVRHVLGSQVSGRVLEWYVRRDNYVVVAVETRRPSMRLVVKVEDPGERPNRHFDAMAAIARLVRTQTSVPTFEVVAVDVTRQRWPWEYLIVTQVSGTTWMELHPRLQEDARRVAQYQIGRAAGQLHGLRFDAFGQIDGAGSVIDGTTAVHALKRRAGQRLTNRSYLERFLDVLDERQHLFESLSTPTLCHEDLNPNNLVFEVRDGRPQLTGVLDFESAWASTGESDLARLELWWMSAGRSVREGYTSLAPLAPDYELRRPLLQLLWCLEFAQFRNTAADQAVLNQVCAELGIRPP
jgi:Ser/Thr protein kinase RdoA (MazF antagonist)